MRKILTQSGIYLIEVVSVVFIMASVFSKLNEDSYLIWLNKVHTYEYLSIVAFYYLVYQILVYVIRTLYVSSQKDAILSVLGIVQFAKIQLKHNRSIDACLKRCHRYLVKEEGKYMFSKRDIETLNILENVLAHYRVGNLDQGGFQHYLDQFEYELNYNMEYANLAWRNSLLLSLLK